MDMDDILPPPRKGTALSELVAEDLDRLSVSELETRIATLECEVARTRAKRDGATKFRSAADELFKR